MRYSTRSKRVIKKTKSDSFVSDDFSESISEKNKVKSLENFEQENADADVIMSGNLVYRYSFDQIELEGFWSVGSETTKFERFSYLYLKKMEKISYSIKKSEIDYTDYNNNFINTNYFSKDEYYINICSANLFEVLLIPHPHIFNSVMNYLSGEYHGFFLYYDKTIEDRFYINFSLDDNQVRISGKVIIL